MAAGEKLGKIFGAVGSGLSFIPGPWSALGVALSAAGTAATAVDQGKQRRDAERDEQNAANQKQNIEVQPDNQRTQTGNEGQNQPTMAGPQSSKVFQPEQSRYNLGRMGENMDNSVMQMLIKESGGWYDG